MTKGLFPIAFSVFAAVAATFVLISAAILFHLNRYAVPGDRTPKLRLAFLIGSVMFFLLALVAFFTVPWNKL